ncbi:hypothetical protein EN836_14445 [Mesorhizobium sp. M1C.F.Ca.ET.193.01.1.1]|uniref:hypothetical protein n=1 Tax=unclassified Mesorhizobium TaxID=325217 RepID=UPI000FD1FB4D|nr:MULTISPECIES: hypothetical protein [unclassified Mesorhizobium]TGS99998.1 hypothetical protein EN820_33170 [bacterium M00.F.Ca.ET.177.01.1.1]TGQ53394.1 hypothetical protein EN853_14440 [Mesorhizobium sp. M1C.F.Ca.ET.210.01.1.1]TGQ70662.1 hypothetical protein EN855_014450 [Mesorhizobium sp. M1C.F.Ca.ET.212.01.1.1]TGR07234.1 hypothetical protein EN847_14440 [Mesorhizobium sp. M1C.F.Ca.ET.204.01.1.1]TGR28108.1 hypothetical protein EN839_14445 [Mesorhizobium sp. M1C.F.Ca.ET.196.01.1.1]
MITKATSTKSTNFIYAPQLRCEQDGDGVFYWLNKNSNTEVKKKISKNSPHPTRYFTRLAIIEADNFADLANNFGSPIYREASSL